MPQAVIDPPAAAPARAGASAQINARISPELKREGDSALAAAGMSPTQAVRALWEFAAAHAARPEAIASTLLGGDGQDADAREERARRARTIARGAGLVADAYARYGLPQAPAPEAPSFAELREAAYAERFGRGLGWA